MSNLALALRMAQESRRADPLARYRFASEIAGYKPGDPTPHRDVIRAVNREIEVHHRAANFGGKTQNIAAWVAAFMQQRKDLAGEPMPTLGRPVVGACLVMTQEQQKDSSQKALRDWIGDWPHFEAMADRGKDIVSTLWVRPENWRNDDPSSWSRLTFVPQGGGDPASIKGQRWDFVWGDEPPVEAFWREARKNAVRRVITETPLDMSEWEWIQADFASAIGQERAGRIEIVSTLDENRYLTAAQVADFEQRYAGDRWYDARRFGKYVDATGDCPFPYQPLNRLLGWAEAGKPAEWDERVEIWRSKREDEQYLIILDPSAGIRPTHESEGGDHCVLWVIGMRYKCGVARFFGYIPPHELAEMAVAASEYYGRGRCMVVPEVNGLGEATLPVLEGRCNLFQEFALERVDKSLSGRVGWTSTEQSKAACVGSLITALAQGTLDIPSAEAVRSLMAIRRDARGKLVRREHQNHEDMVTLGIAAYLMQHPSYALPMLKEPREMTPREVFEAQVLAATGQKMRTRELPSGLKDRWR